MTKSPLAVAWLVLAAWLASCGTSVDGGLQIQLVGNCSPGFEQIASQVDTYCLAVLRADGQVEAEQCAPTLAALSLSADESSGTLVRVLVEGRQGGQTVVRGLSVPVRLVSGEQRTLSIAVALVNRFSFLAALQVGGSCRPLPFGVGYGTALATPSGHLLVPTTPDPGADRYQAALLMDPATNRFSRLQTPLQLRRAVPAAALLDDGRVVVAGGWDGETGDALDSVAVLRGGEPLVRPYDRAVDYSQAYFEMSPHRLARARVFPTFAVFNGSDLLLADGVATAEIWQGQNEQSAFVTLQPGSADPFPVSGDEAAAVVPLGPDQAAVLGGVANHQGVLNVSGGRQLYFTEFGLADAVRNRPAGLVVGEGLVMFMGGFDVSALGQDLVVVLDVANRVLYPVPVNEAAFPRQGFTANLLPDGRVFVAGGVSAHAQFVPGATFFLERSGPGPGDWQMSDGPALLLPRAAHVSALLPDGRLVLLGGVSADGATSDEEVFLSAEVIAFP